MYISQEYQKLIVGSNKKTKQNIFLTTIITTSEILFTRLCLLSTVTFKACFDIQCITVSAIPNIIVCDISCIIVTYEIVQI